MAERIGQLLDLAGAGDGIENKAIGVLLKGFHSGFQFLQRAADNAGQHKANHQSHKGKYYLHHARSPLFSDVKYIVSLYPYDTEKSTVLPDFRAKKSPSRIAIFSESNFHKLTQQNVLQKVYRYL